MAIIDHDHAVATSTAKTIVNLTVPLGATGAELQCTTQTIRYTLDGKRVATAAIGFLMTPTMPPKEFLLEDIRNISFIRGGGSDAELQIHWFGGREI